MDTKVSGVGMKYAYITNVNRIFGEDVAAGGSKSNTHLLNVGKKFSAGQLTGYFYGIDNEDQLAFSTSTLGVKWAGKKLFGNPNFSYGLEYASQSDAADSPLDYTADYLRLDAAYKFKPVKFYVGYEVLGSDDGVAAFRTPLATLHAFNGWADKFLGTPNTGLEDVFVGISGQAGRFKWNAKYHDFTSDVNGLDFGNELDFSIGTKIAKNYNVLLKYADFSADDDGGSDVSKLWVMLQAKF
ncbi:MAG: hypothetical protein HKO58_10200 [Gammaproteobacteria bacterium]|nr:hypothetical protein [Gammaproteobacteria bacterium]